MHLSFYSSNKQKKYFFSLKKKIQRKTNYRLTELKETRQIELSPMRYWFKGTLVQGKAVCKAGRAIMHWGMGGKRVILLLGTKVISIESTCTEYKYINSRMSY